MRRGGQRAEDAGQKLTDPVVQDVQRCVKLNAAAEIQKGEIFRLNKKKKEREKGAGQMPSKCSVAF